MPVPDLAELQSATPPFASVTVDVTASDPAADDDVRLRWRAAADALRDAGAPERVRDLVGERVLAGTGLGGEHTRVVVADDRAGVVVDRVVPGRPARPESSYGPLPVVTALLRAASTFVPHVLVRLDRAGADIEVRTAPEARPLHGEVEGDHDVLHKVPGGGWSHRRIQARVEDSWAHNAGAVADVLDTLCRRHPVEVVAVAGEDHAWAETRDRVGGRVAGLLVRLGSGGRADGTSDEAEAAALEQVLANHRASRRASLLEAFEEQRSRQQRAVEGLDAVVDALRRGQVDHLLLRDDPSSTLTLWAGEEPLQIGMTEESARDTGARAPVEARADTVITRALLGSGADLVLVEDDPVELLDGIGALLRWSDDATAHGRAPSMPGHGEAPGSTDRPD